MCVSLVGDGIFLVAMAWQVYALSNVPTALSTVGIAMTVPTIAFLLLGGVVSDRLDRRRVILASDLGRAAAVAIVAALAVAGWLQLWHIVVLAAVYGTGTGFFAPAFDAIVPELLPNEQLGQANALDQFVRPLTLRLLGPALGGLLIVAGGSGFAFAVDAASFLASAAAVLAMTPRPRAAERNKPAQIGAEVADGFRYVRRHVWLWGTFAAAAIAYLAFMGPTEVLLPFLVKNTLHGSAFELGIVLAAGGLASLACAALMGQSDLPRKSITFIYVTWTVATFAVAGYGLSTALWQVMLVSAAFNALETAGTIVWATLKQRNVPTALLGRVSSLDWLISIGLLPVSLALTSPVSAAIGVRVTLVCAGLVGGLVTFAALWLPGMRALERNEHGLPESGVFASSSSS
jgi:DHA3 family tetracycline resistance protein-like MFS transporter